MRTWVDTRKEVLLNNERYLREKEAGNRPDPECDCVTAVLTGRKATEFIWMLGQEDVDDVLKQIRKDLATMPRFAALVVEGVSDVGLRYRATFIKEYEVDDPEHLGYFRMGFQFS